MQNDDKPGRERLEAAAHNLQDGVSDRLGELWSSFLVRGLLVGALGICVLVWPSASVAILVRLVGLFFIIDGISALVGPLRGAARGTNLLRAIAVLVIGAALLFWTGASARILMLAFGAWALINGVSLFFNSRGEETTAETRGPLTIASVVLVILGAVMVFWPSAGVVTIAWLIGGAALILAVLLIFLSTRIKNVKRRVDTVGR